MFISRNAAKMDEVQRISDRVLPRDRASPKIGICLTGLGILILPLEFGYFILNLFQGSFILEALQASVVGAAMLAVGLLLLRYSKRKGAFGPYWIRGGEQYS